MGWSACALFAALRDQRGESSYDPYELDGLVAVSEFSDALRGGSKVLRELEQVFDTGLMPSESVTLHNQAIVFSGFRRVLVVRFLRSTFQKAFAVQMAQNEYLFNLLDYAVGANPAKVKLSSVEKRLFKSPNSGSARSASKDLKKDRHKKMMQNSFTELPQ